MEKLPETKMDDTMIEICDNEEDDSDDEQEIRDSKDNTITGFDQEKEETLEECKESPETKYEPNLSGLDTPKVLIDTLKSLEKLRNELVENRSNLKTNTSASTTTSNILLNSKTKNLLLLLIAKTKQLIDKVSSLISDVSKSKDGNTAALDMDLETLLWGLTLFQSDDTALGQTFQSYKVWIKSLFGEDELDKLKQFKHVDNKLKEIPKPVDCPTETKNSEYLSKTERITTVVDKIEPKEINSIVAPITLEDSNALLVAALTKTLTSHLERSTLITKRLKVSTYQELDIKPIERYEKLLTELSQKNEMFLDAEFPPNPRSISRHMEAFKKGQNVIWKRLSQMIAPEYLTLFNGDPNPFNIRQGKVGDCYFLSSLSVLAERPSLIKRLFYTQEYNKQGCNSIWLCDSGEWKNIIIDDFVPFKPMKIGKKLQFFGASSNKKDIWVMLIEKAFAKLFQNYHVIQAGKEAEALRALTGAPTEYYWPEEKDHNAARLEGVWGFISNSIKNKWVVTADSKSEKKVLEGNRKFGIVSVHSYAILDAREIEISPGVKERLIKMRNPWGNQSWSGDWGNRDPRWTEELRLALNYTPKKNNGVYWIDLTNFDKHFQYVCHCKVHDDYLYKFIKIPQSQDNNTSIVQISVSEKTHLYATVFQKDRRHWKRVQEYAYSFMRFYLVKVDDNYNVISYINGKYLDRPTISFGQELEKGNYIAYVEVDWNQEFMNQIVLGVYSDKDVDLFDLSSDNKINNLRVLKDIYRFHASCRLMQKADFNYHVPSLFQKIGCPEIMRFDYPIHKYQYYYYFNPTEDVVLVDQLKFNFNGVILCDPDAKEVDTITTVVKPHESKIVLLRRLEGPKSKYTFLYNPTKLPYYTDEQLAVQAVANEEGKKHYKDVNVVLHTLNFKGGSALYFYNYSKEALELTLTFSILQNLEVSESSEITFRRDILGETGTLFRLTVIDLIKPTHFDINAKFEKA